MKLNLPNKLTVLRIILIPFFVFFYLTSLVPQPAGEIISLIVFAIASYTDHLDGKIARSRQMITNFGKFIDPLADKLLVSSAIICFVEKGLIPSWIAIILIGREFVISGFRLLASDRGIIISAGIWGKLKTITQMIMIILFLIDLSFTWFKAAETVFMYLSMILSVFSCIDYFIKNKEVLNS